MNLLTNYAGKFKALGHPVRLQIVIGLVSNECNVTKICKFLNLPQATISRHLQVLKASGIVKGERNGSEVCYHVIDKKIKRIISVIAGADNE